LLKYQQELLIKILRFQTCRGTSRSRRQSHLYFNDKECFNKTRGAQNC